jgi:hypothetical protein
MVKFKISPSDFWKLTLQEYWIYALGFYEETEEKKNEVEGQLILFKELLAHIANFSMYKKKDGSAFTRKDFEPVKLNEGGKLTMKAAKERLGSKFTLN